MLSHSVPDGVSTLRIGVRGFTFLQSDTPIAQGGSWSKLTIATCQDCSTFGEHLYMKVGPDGEAFWHAGNQRPRYLPKCTKGFVFLAQLAVEDVDAWGEGIYYALMCPDCSITVVRYQQT